MDVRLERLRTQHQIVAADLATITARADQHRAASILMRARTDRLVAELRLEVEHAQALKLVIDESRVALKDPAR